MKIAKTKAGEECTPILVPAPRQVLDKVLEGLLVEVTLITNQAIKQHNQQYGYEDRGERIRLNRKAVLMAMITQYRKEWTWGYTTDGWVETSPALLAEYCDCHPHSAASALRKLRKLGFLVDEQRGNYLHNRMYKIHPDLVGHLHAAYKEAITPEGNKDGGIKGDSRGRSAVSESPNKEAQQQPSRSHATTVKQPGIKPPQSVNVGVLKERILQLQQQEQKRPNSRGNSGFSSVGDIVSGMKLGRDP